MGVAALATAILAIVLGLLPLVYTQLAGIVAGIIAVVLAVWAQRESASRGQSSNIPLAGLALGLVAVLLSAVLYGAFIFAGQRLGEESLRRAEGELQGVSERGGREFREALQRIISQGNGAAASSTSSPSPAAASKTSAPPQPKAPKR